MSQTLISALFVLALALLIGLMTWADKRWPGLEDQTPRRTADRPTICARCRFRDGDDCTNPKSPAYPGPVGEVCIGRWKCKVREERSHSV